MTEAWPLLLSERCVMTLLNFSGGETVISDHWREDFHGDAHMPPPPLPRLSAHVCVRRTPALTGSGHTLKSLLLIWAWGQLPTFYLWSLMREAIKKHLAATHAADLHTRSELRQLLSEQDSVCVWTNSWSAWVCHLATNGAGFIYLFIFHVWGIRKFWMRIFSEAAEMRRKVATCSGVQ